MILYYISIALSSLIQFNSLLYCLAVYSKGITKSVLGRIEEKRDSIKIHKASKIKRSSPDTRVSSKCEVNNEVQKNFIQRIKQGYIL